MATAPLSPVPGPGDATRSLPCWRRPDPGGPDTPTVLVHGFSQTHVAWAPVADRLGPGPVVTPDLPGHGATDPALDDADLSAAAALLGATVGRSRLVGYSMGGRVALRLALDRPDLVDRLVLVGATAGIDDPAARADRRAADGARAARIERDGVDAFLADWLAQPLFAGLDPTTEDLAARRANRPAGLAGSLRHAGTGTMDPPWWDELGRLTMPVLVVSGARDAKFTALAERLVAAIGPSASAAVVADAGHAVPLEAPAAFATLLDDWGR